MSCVLPDRVYRVSVVVRKGESASTGCEVLVNGKGAEPIPELVQPPALGVAVTPDAVSTITTVDTTARQSREPSVDPAMHPETPPSLVITSVDEQDTTGEYDETVNIKNIPFARLHQAAKIAASEWTSLGT
ncbi:hypothetical protein FBU59_006689, partial [Linderina macrospora]